jgi:hypothetical protein
LIASRPASIGSQIAAIAALALVIVARHWFHAVTQTPLNDEIPYLRAVDFVLAGQSPYTRGLYLYPPLLAVVGARIVDSVGVAPFLWLLRGLSYLGMAVTVWITLLTVPWRRWFLPAAVAFLCLAPAVTFSIVIHNISPLVAGATLLALWIWPRRPLVAGVLLGVGAVLKPMVILVPVLLFLHRPRAGGPRHLVAGAVSAGVAGLLLWLPPYLPEMLSLASKQATIPRSVSFHRLAYLAGWEGSAIWVSAIIALVALVVVRRLELGRLELLVVSVTATLMATPVLWSHTLVLSLPVQAMALERLTRRRQSDRFRFETAFVLLSVAAIQLSGGAGSVDDQGSAFQVFSTLPIAIAPLAVAAYLMMTGGCREVEAGQ